MLCEVKDIVYDVLAIHCVNESVINNPSKVTSLGDECLLQNNACLLLVCAV